MFLVAAVLATVGPAAVSCTGGTSRDAVIEQVRAPQRSDGTTSPLGPGSTDGPPATRPPDAAVDEHAAAPDDATRPKEDDDATLALTQSVLDRYDAAITVVAADPLSAAGGGPGLEQWNATVVASGSFSVSILGDMVDRATHESTVVRPGSDGRSYRHHVLRATAEGSSVSFTWCGHAPGIGVDVTTGEIVDDAVALSSGTGELVHDGVTWRLLTLDAFDIDVAASGTADPCPAEVAAIRRNAR